jgi:DNA-binding NtrC family response regulator
MLKPTETPRALPGRAVPAFASVGPTASTNTPATPAVAGVSSAWMAVVSAARRAGALAARVLITGESGVGKDVVARLVHASSPRSSHSFVAVNCAGVAETLLESELFGHVKGSFTGAWRDTHGLVQRAHGGTLFLDEIGETSLRMQALLLRFVETGEVQQVGSISTRPSVDTRIIAATNRNLSELVASGRFREDLLYRLAAIQIHVPPLRDRREDIGPLVEHVMARQPRPVRISPGAMAALEQYAWPGNIRELQNVVEQAVWLAPGDAIGIEHLPENVRPQRVVARPARDRRRSQADRLFEALVNGRCSFWGDVHAWFLERDLTRADLRGLIGLGLAETHGNYHALLKLFRLPAEDYKRFLNFLGAHGCSIDVRPYRQGTADPHEARWSLPIGEGGTDCRTECEVPGHERGTVRSA